MDLRGSLPQVLRRPRRNDEVETSDPLPRLMCGGTADVVFGGVPTQHNVTILLMGDPICLELLPALTSTDRAL